MSAAVHYTTRGPVRGACGHRHRSLGAAVACAERDRRACAALGGGAYSDREVVRADGARLTWDELRWIDELTDGDRGRP